MNWTLEDTTQNWMKVRNAEGRAYFILWEQDAAFLAIALLPVIPADPAESTRLTVTLAAGELPWLTAPEVATSVIRCRQLMRLWWRERRRLEKSGDLEPVAHVFPVRPRRTRTASPASRRTARQSGG